MRFNKQTEIPMMSSLAGWEKRQTREYEEMK